MQFGRIFEVFIEFFQFIVFKENVLILYKNNPFKPLNQFFKILNRDKLVTQSHLPIEAHQIVEIEWREASNELKSLKYTGGGGTDFRPLIEAAAESAPDVLIYLTDLFGEMGDAPYFPVIWATHGVAGNAKWGEQIKLK